MAVVIVTISSLDSTRLFGLRTVGVKYIRKVDARDRSHRKVDECLALGQVKGATYISARLLIGAGRRFVSLLTLRRRLARGIRQAHRTTAKAWIPFVVLLTGFFPTLSSAQWAQLGPDLDGAWIGEAFGHAVALSSDGSRVAVGAPLFDQPLRLHTSFTKNGVGSDMMWFRKD